MSRACLVLPPRSRFAGESLPVVVARALGRADASQGQAGVESLFDVLPRGWPAAAVTRQVDAGDAANALWLRADPAYVRPDINGARLLAVGEMLALDAAEADALLRPLRPLFGDSGMPIDAGRPSAWYLRLPIGAPVPTLASPDEALGADLFDLLPSGPEGRRWRALLSEAQVLLHQNPLNAERQARGLAPINSVWFWGAGTLPDRIGSEWRVVLSPDETVHAFAKAAGANALALDAWNTATDAAAYDLRHERRLDRLCQRWLEPALADLAAGKIATLRLVWGDGHIHELRKSQSLRFWRRPLRALAERDDG